MSRTPALLLAFVLVLAPLASGGEEVAAPGDETAVAGDEDALREPVEALYAALLATMKRAEDLGFEGRYAELAPVVSTRYDLGFMGSRVLGRGFTRLTPEQQASWLRTFARLTVSTYADRFDGFSGERFEIGAVESSRSGTWIVRSRLLPSDAEPVAIDYRVRNGGEGWRIVDVYLSGTVSELALRRAEYSSVLKRDGFDALNAAVLEKIAAAEAGTSEADS